MMKNFLKEYEDGIQIDLDPIVESPWLPDYELRLSEYQNMITYYVQNYIERNSNALGICTEKVSNRL